MQINPVQNGMIGFRKQGGRVNLGQKQLRDLKYYRHLGITLQTSGVSFIMHNVKLMSKVWSMVDIQSSSKLSLGTAIKLYLEKALRVSRFIPL
jgi:hypothetical protein